jgi:hypothetical protein
MKDFLPLTEFAALAGVSRQAALKIVNAAKLGKVWQGATLIVRPVNGAGGRSGLSYQIRADSLPSGLQLRLREAQANALPALRTDDNATAMSRFWEHLLSPLAIHPKGSNARGLAIRETAAREHLLPDGTKRRFTERTIRRKLDAFERHGLAGLAPTKRGDFRKARVILTREFDTAARAKGLADGEIEKTAKHLQGYVRGLIVKGVARKVIELFANRELNNLASKSGIGTDGKPFSTPAHFIQRERDYRRVATYRRDRKSYDDAKPRIRRTRDGLLPMDVVFADVHPVDIPVLRDDGTIGYARMIAFHDIATNRLFYHVVLCDKGMGIRNAHVIQCFMDMVAGWGVPKTLYIDNGSEFNFAELLRPALLLLDPTNKRPIINAKPYNAAAKPIESIFRVIEHTYFSMIPEWVGGDRQRKKTANVGQAVAPIRSFKRYRANIESCIALYHDAPQPALGKRSPFDAYQAFINDGWHKIDADQGAFELAFSREQRRQVRQGCIEYDGSRWTCRELQAYQGTHVIALVPQYDKWNRLPLKNQAGEIFGYAQRCVALGYLDSTGAAESAARAKAHREGMIELEKSAPDVDPLEELEKNVVRFPAAPKAPIAATLGQSDQARAISERLHETPEDQVSRQAREIDNQIDKQLDRFNRGANLRKGT